MRDNNGNSDIKGKKCPFRKIETRKGLFNITRDVDFKECLENRCPYYMRYGIYCTRAKER